MAGTTLSAPELHATKGRYLPRWRAARRHPVLSWLLETVFELNALAAAWLCTIEVRLVLNPVMSIQFSRERLEQTAPPLAGIIGLWLLTKFWLAGSRDARRYSTSLTNIRFSETIILVSAVTIIAAFFSQGFGALVSRSFVLIFTPLSYILLVLASSLDQYLWGILMSRWPELVEKVAILGRPEDAHVVLAGVRKTPGAAFAGAIVPVGYNKIDPHSGHGIAVLGTAREVAEVVNREQLNRVIILTGALSEDEYQRCTTILRRMGVVASRALGAVAADSAVELSTEFGLHMLDERPLPFRKNNQVIKAILDFLTAAVLLAIVSPVLIVAATLIRLTSPGPVIYRSTRVGKGGRHFTFLKFRTMYYDPEGRKKVRQGNEREGHLFKIKRDPRITPIGKILRRYSIDELPQLINVLRGEMSLLGPRPLPAEDLGPDGMSEEYRLWAEQRSSVRPGVTGLWQIRGRSDLSFHEMVELDLEYVREWSLFLDLKIMLATPLVVITGRGAY